MKRIILIFFVITAGCSTACHSERTYKTGSGAANSAAKQDTTTTGAPSQDTLSLSGRCVIFFEPDAGEFDTLSAGNEANLGKLTSFRDYNKQIIPFLKKKSISHFQTSQKIFRIRMDDGSVTILRKSELGDIVGIIMTDGIKKPAVLPGVTSDSDFFLKMKNYFEPK